VSGADPVGGANVVSGNPRDRGLCATCAHAQVITSARGSTFSLCTLSFVDSRFAKYPVLPVRHCDGYSRDAGADH
jgi:hypothetical protein